MVSRDPEEVTADDIETAEDAAELLGVDLGADADGVERAHQNMVLDFHPDAVSDDMDTTEGMAALNKAHDMLISYEGEEAAEFATSDAKSDDIREEREEQFGEILSAVRNMITEDMFGKMYDELSEDEKLMLNKQMEESFSEGVSVNDVAEIISHLIVSGAVQVGSVKMSVDEGVFRSRKGGDDPFRDRSGGNDDVFR